MEVKTLITAGEVVRYGPVHPDYPTDYVCDHIKRKEQSLFRKCYLGMSFYKMLIEDLNDYSDVEAYDSDTTYQLGELMCYDGCVYVSLCSDNDAHPDDDGGKCWTYAKKFDSDCLCYLWDCNLKYWLAYEICYTSIDYATYHMAAHGATKQVQGDRTSQVTASRLELDQLKRKMRKDADEHLENMLEWMIEETKSEATKCDFTMVQQVSTACGKEECIPFKRRRSRRFYFKQ